MVVAGVPSALTAQPAFPNSYWVLLHGVLVGDSYAHIPPSWWALPKPGHLQSSPARQMAPILPLRSQRLGDSPEVPAWPASEPCSQTLSLIPEQRCPQSGAAERSLSQRALAGRTDKFPVQEVARLAQRWDWEGVQGSLAA